MKITLFGGNKAKDLVKGLNTQMNCVVFHLYCNSILLDQALMNTAA